MARALTSGMLTALTARNVRPILLVSLNFSSGQVNLWSGLGSLVWNSTTFTGTGTLGTVSEVPEATDGSAVGVKMSLTGIPTTVIALAVAEQYQGYEADIWLGAFDLVSGALVADSYQLCKGIMDVMTISDGTTAATISITIESRLIEYDRPRERRYTKFDQNIDFPLDTGFDYVNSLQDLQIYWGDPNGAIASYPGAGGTGPGNP